MPNLVYGPATICAGGGHATLSVTLNGGPSRTFVYTVEQLRAPLSDISDEDLATAALVIGKIKGAGKTAAQVRTALQAGFTVTI